jgi:CBS domain-containing protein
MPTTVKQLLDDRPAPTVIESDEKALTAIEKMIEHNFSQLPVIDEHNKLQGIITSESILIAAKNLQVTVDVLEVWDAILKPHKYKLDDELPDLLEGLQTSNAVIIVSETNAVEGILTRYDVMQYFRRKVEDFMLVEDIETTIKDIIKSTFRKSDGEIDNEALSATVAGITYSNRKEQKKFRRAIAAYLQYAEASGALTSEVNSKIAARAYKENLQEINKPRDFDELSLADYISLFLKEEQWSKYGDFISDDHREGLRNLLDSVREIRNNLMHFRDSDLSYSQRESLQYCADLLSGYQSKMMPLDAAEIYTSDTSEAIAEVKPERSPRSEQDQVALINPDQKTPINGYKGLVEFLQNRYSQFHRTSLVTNFASLETKIGDKLPGAARVHRSWWSNAKSSFHPCPWLDAGWLVDWVKLDQEIVRFVRAEEPLES